MNKIKIAYVFTSCRQSGPIQVMLNLLSNIDRTVFDPVLVTIYKENYVESKLNDFLSLGISHVFCPLNKMQILIGKTKSLKILLKEINPDIVHSMGVFPEFAISKMNIKYQVITLHNYMFDDFIPKFGYIKGYILTRMQLYAVKHSKKVWTCSKSLTDIYSKKNNLYFNYIRNGINIDKYCPIKVEETRTLLRERLSLPIKKIIFIYTGQFTLRKNQEYLLKLFSTEKRLKNHVLLLLGEGEKFCSLKAIYRNNSNIIFAGNVDNVEDYLNASDFYISSSLSEGLPTSVLEAMACGLPIILSNISQHMEIFEVNESIGFTFDLKNPEDCVAKIIRIASENSSEKGRSSMSTARKYFSASIMTENYEKEYLSLIT